MRREISKRLIYIGSKYSSRSPWFTEHPSSYGILWHTFSSQRSTSSHTQHSHRQSDHRSAWQTALKEQPRSLRYDSNSGMSGLALVPSSPSIPAPFVTRTRSEQLELSEYLSSGTVGSPPNRYYLPPNRQHIQTQTPHSKFWFSYRGPALSSNTSDQSNHT